MKSKFKRKISPLKPTFVREDKRGTFIEVLNEGPWETVTHGSMKKGAVMGNHYHRACRAYFYLVKGQAKINILHLIDETKDSIVLKSNEGIFFLPFETHAIHYEKDSDFIFLKSYRYNESEPDIFPHKIKL